MAKARVHELAKEFGVPSKDVLAALKDMGEFVKSASSTVEAPVARRLEETHGEAWKKAAEAKAAKKAAKKAPAKKATAADADNDRTRRGSRRGRSRPGHHRRAARRSRRRPAPGTTAHQRTLRRVRAGSSREPVAPAAAADEPSAEPEAPAASADGSFDRGGPSGAQARNPSSRQQPVLVHAGHAAAPATGSAASG